MGIAEQLDQEMNDRILKRLGKSRKVSQEDVAKQIFQERGLAGVEDLDVEKVKQALLEHWGDKEAFVDSLAGPKLSDGRLSTIYENETHMANRAAQQLIAQNQGARYKTWVAQPDACPDCDSLSGESVHIDSKYSNRQQLPHAHVNCRCDEIYSDE